MKRTFIFLLCLLPLWGLTANFVVTTNQSTGSGSLAQAVADAAANGSLVTDFISFNLPESQTTIQINSPLILSSNLVIDGTTQPGRAFGLTNSKVRLQATTCTVGLSLNGLDNVEIYGLWFTDFKSSGLSCYSAAISIRNTSHFVLGKPGKGNCFTNNTTCIVNPWQLSQDSTENVDLSIQANRFAMDTLYAPDENSSNIAFGATRRFLFGGEIPEEGNRIGNAFVNVGNFYIPLSVNADTIAFKNNLFGFDAFNGSLNSSIGLFVAGYKAKGSQLNVVISNNKIGKDDVTNKIWVTDVTGNILINNNYIGSLNTSVTPGDITSAIYLENCTRKDSIVVRNNSINGYRHAVLLFNSKTTTITANSIYCTQKGISYNRLDDIPIISFLSLTNNYLKGSTIPLSTVEIFSSNTCNQFCENGKLLVAKVKANDQGVFEYNGSLDGNISATATTASGITGEFYGAKFSISNVIIKNATCGINNGYIRGVQVVKGNTFFWENEAGKVVSTDTAAYNLGAGNYRFYIKDSLSSCPVYSPYFTLKSIPKPFVDSTFSIVNTSCGKSRGKIILNGLRSPESFGLWQDSAHRTIQTLGDSIVNLAPGTYYYRVALFSDTACFTDYGPFKVLNIDGPVVTYSSAIITSSICGGSTGSISNIKVQNAMGQTIFLWQDSTSAVVANTLELANQPAGRYRLKFKDASFCDTLVTPYFTITARGGIKIDTSGRIIKASGCTSVNGAIINVNVEGAEYIEWKNVTNNQQVSTITDLLNIPPGYYQLNAGNSIGCTDTSSVMYVPPATFAAISIVSKQQQQPNCGLSNGFVKILSFSSDSSGYIFSWKDSVTGSVISNNSHLQNVNTGSYFLQAVDTNNCIATLLSTKLVQAGKPVIDLSQIKLQHDTCNLSKGHIKNVAVTGGGQPYRWQWFLNGNNTPFSGTVGGTENLKKGTYSLRIADNYNCEATATNILIADYDKQLNTPIADNVSVPRNSVAEIVVENFMPGTYSLFDTSFAALPYRISNGATLTTPRVAYDKTFYLQYTLGSCSSPLHPVLVKVFDESKIALPNAFSPNGDGINDVWKMQVQGLITVKEWLLFNRYGQLMFSTKDASWAWDGKIKNADVPVGIYYYVIITKDYTGKEVKQQGSVTLVR